MNHFAELVDQINPTHTLLVPNAIYFKHPGSKHCSDSCPHVQLVALVQTTGTFSTTTLNIVGTERCYKSGHCISKEVLVTRSFPVNVDSNESTKATITVDLCPLDFPASVETKRGSIKYTISISNGSWTQNSRNITVHSTPTMDTLAPMVDMFCQTSPKTNISCTVEGSRLLFVHTDSNNQQHIVSPFRPTLMLGEGYYPIVYMEYGIIENTEAYAGKYKSLYDISKPSRYSTKRVMKLKSSSIQTGIRIPLDILDLNKSGFLNPETNGNQVHVSHSLYIKLHFESELYTTFYVPIQLVSCH